MSNASSFEEDADDEAKEMDDSDMDKDNDRMHSSNDTDDDDENSSRSSRDPEDDDSNAIAVDTGIVVAGPEFVEDIDRACTGKSACSPTIVIMNTSARSDNDNASQSSVPSGAYEREQEVIPEPPCKRSGLRIMVANLLGPISC